MIIKPMSLWLSDLIFCLVGVHWLLSKLDFRQHPFHEWIRFLPPFSSSFMSIVLVAVVVVGGGGGDDDDNVGIVVFDCNQLQPPLGLTLSFSFHRRSPLPLCYPFPFLPPLERH